MPKKVRDPDGLLSLAEVRAQLGGLSESTVARLVARGELATVKIGRRRLVEPAELRRFVRRHRGRAMSRDAREVLRYLDGAGFGIVAAEGLTDEFLLERDYTPERLGRAVAELERAGRVRRTEGTILELIRSGRPAREG